MNNFVRRLKYYGVGFGLGLIFVFFFFKNRGCSWTPNNRVKNAILDRMIVIPASEQQEINKLGLSDSLVKNFLNSGDVDFGASDKEDPVKNYIIEHEGVKLLFSLPSESFISEVSVFKKDPNRAVSDEGVGRMIHIPNDENIFYLDSIETVVDPLKSLGIDDGKEVLKAFKRNGVVNFGKSDLTVRPKPVQYLEFVLMGDTVGVKATWYKNKINVFDVVFSDK